MNAKKTDLHASMPDVVEIYETPSVETIEIAAEQGFAISSGIPSFGDGGAL